MTRTQGRQWLVTKAQGGLQKEHFQWMKLTVQWPRDTNSFIGSRDLKQAPVRLEGGSKEERFGETTSEPEHRQHWVV